MCIRIRIRVSNVGRARGDAGPVRHHRFSIDVGFEWGLVNRLINFTSSSVKLPFLGGIIGRGSVIGRPSSPSTNSNDCASRTYSGNR